MTLSCFQLVAAASTIYNAFIKEESLWPSEFWRLSGVVINEQTTQETQITIQNPSGEIKFLVIYFIWELS
jgi:hypothetical protein